MSSYKKISIYIFASVIILSISALMFTACASLSKSEDSSTIESGEESEGGEIEVDAKDTVSSIISKTGMLEGVIFEVGNRLFAVDPENGEITAVRDFTPLDEDVEVLSDIGNNTFQSLQYYNKDLTKRLARKKVSVPEHDGIYEHIGWVNTDGQFEDITAMLENFEDDSSFVTASDPLSMRRARNYRDLFIYAESEKDSKVYRTPIGEYMPAKLETYQYGAEVGEFSGGDTAHVDPTGTMVGMENDGYYRQLESGEHEYVWPEGHQEIEEKATELLDVTKNTTLRWISKNSYIMARDLTSDDYSALYLCQRDSGNKFTCRAITPYVEGRKNLSYAISPDNQKVAIISRKGDKSDFYIGKVSGSSAPEVLAINEDPLYDLELDETVDLMKGKLLCWSFGGNHQQDLELKYYLDTPECLYQTKRNAEKYGEIDN